MFGPPYKPFQIVAIAAWRRGRAITANFAGLRLQGLRSLVLKIITLFDIMAVKINDAVPGSLDARDVGPGDNSGLAGVSDGTRHDQFDGIDWSGAAPGWGSMFAGLVVPLLGFALMTVCIDLGLIWLAGRWAGAASASPLLLAAIMFPAALVIALGCCKLVVHLKDAAKTAVRSAEHKSVA